jgi:riboflavin transporter FmnP
MILPLLLTWHIPQLAMALSPMHIPVLLCAFLCGSYYAVAIGAVAPLLRFMLFGLPPIFPMGTAMCFELAIYGLVAGLMYKKLPKKKLFVFVSLITAMLCGRVVWGVAMAVQLGARFSWGAFVAGAFTNAIPGILLHIVLIPSIVFVLAPKLHKNDK